MRDVPIIFSAPMVRALLDSRKTQTRRLVPQPPAECGINYMLGEESWLPVEKRTPVRRAFEAWTGPLFQNRPAGHLCGSFDIRPRFQPRDRLWVRENFATSDAYAGPGILGVEYAADGATLAYANGELHHKEHGCAQYTGPWKPSIHMPRWASRLTLVVEQVRVERLQDTTRKDVYAEGAITDEWLQWREDAVNIGMPEGSSIEDERDVFARLWTSLHGADAWAANPWVVALTFSVHRTNIDKLEAREVAIG
ncbi:hypothetical protein TSH58p_17350 [Azospirillum sp. TSH58]|uniref:hypothetical protein n=1 Tax=Azospirillum sp. TSH58 TaxID=664962 RepID=UPI000D5FF847|nr:hypothetical protein [Azospirillum sp. TSH58]AWJ85131.1 hypothetical protein TSH58p_17350 [Azospirillum sp. TSH58]PWC80808.1 hypothetical protein TSH58_00755 [Azospirillum sp. TSH58]